MRWHGMQGLNNKVAVITGAGSGIGQAAAVRLARAGATVAVCDLNRDSAGTTVEQIADAGGNATAHVVDVSSEAQMRQLVDEVLNQHGQVDAVVNNAGIVLKPTPTVELNLEDFRRMVDINFWGVVYGSLFFLPHLLARPNASLVNVASNAALLAYGRMAPYSSSKFAVRGFTEALRMELRRTGVRVTLVCPGATRTSIMANSPVMDANTRDSMQRQLDQAWARPVGVVAEAITKAICHGKPRALTGIDSKVLDRLARWFPGRYSRLLGPAVDMFLDKNISGLGEQ